MTLGEKIKTLRKDKKISQEQLASILQINRNHLSRIETDKSEPTASILKDITKLFGISLNSLLDIEETGQTQEEKINYIISNCRFLHEKDIDFIVRIISIMREEYVKKNT